MPVLGQLSLMMVHNKSMHRNANAFQLYSMYLALAADMIRPKRLLATSQLPEFVRR